MINHHQGVINHHQGVINHTPTILPDADTLYDIYHYYDAGCMTPTRGVTTWMVRLWHGFYM